MHTALAIVAHALRMLIFETAMTIRVVMPALVLVLGSAFVAVLFAPNAVVAFQSTPETMILPDTSTILLMFILGIIGLLGYALMAVLWHRHVLMNTAESKMAFPTASLFLSYVGRAIMVALMQLLAGIPIALAMGIFGSLLVPVLGGLALMVIGVLGGLAFVWVALRISLVLPAAALGHAMNFSESWEATKPLSSTIWSLAALLACLNLCVMMLTNAIAPDQGGFAMIAQTVVYVIEGLVFISVLTTLYGNLVEGRSLG